MKKKNYSTYLNEAYVYKQNLDKCISNGDNTGIIYNRGNYITSLKHLYRLNPTKRLPSVITSLPVEEELKNQLILHQNVIDTEIKKGKSNKVKDKNGKIKVDTQLKLNADNLRASIESLKLMRTSDEKKQGRKKVAKNSLKLGGASLIKVTSILGPLAIWVGALPLVIVASGISFFWTLSEGKTPQFNEYANTPINQISNALQNAVRSLSQTTYDVVKKI